MNILYLTIMISLLMIGFSACQSADETSGTEDSEKNEVLLQHTVYFYLNDDVTAEEREQFETGLKQLLKIPEIHMSELGIPAATDSREVTDHSFAYSIFTWFRNMEDYAVYEKHPDHLEFIETYSPLWADVKVYDTELLDVQ